MMTTRYASSDSSLHRVAPPEAVPLPALAAYFEMALWFLDRKRAARVDYDAIRSPVLSITGSQDKCTVPGSAG